MSLNHFKIIPLSSNHSGVIPSLWGHSIIQNIQNEGVLTSGLEWEGWLMNDGMVVEWLDWGWNDEYFWWRKFWTPPSLSIPVIYSHFEMTFPSFDGHSDTEWPKNDWNDAGMTIFSSWNDLEWLEWGWNDSNFWSKANALDFFLSHPVLIQS